MAYMITSQCIGCDRCFSVCPTEAIQKTNQHYQINPSRCNNCVGYYGTPQCWAVCPTNTGCIPGDAIALSQLGQVKGDYWDHWFDTYHRLISRLHQANRSEYWEQWFDLYSQKLSDLLQRHSLEPSHPASAPQ